VSGTADFKSAGGEIPAAPAYVMCMAKSKSDPTKMPPKSSERGKADRPDLVGPPQKPGEIGGRKGPEPTRYGDWEVGGRCTDF